MWVAQQVEFANHKDVFSCVGPNYHYMIILKAHITLVYLLIKYFKYASILGMTTIAFASIGIFKIGMVELNSVAVPSERVHFYYLT